MKIVKNRYFALLFLSLNMGFSVSTCLAEPVNIEITNIQYDTGTIRIALHDDGDSFDTMGNTGAFVAVLHRATKEPIALTIHDVPPGYYAVIVHHDENNNQIMDKKMMVLPSEDFGLSNGASCYKSPSFEQSLFEVKQSEEGQEITITKVEIELEHCS